MSVLVKYQRKTSPCSFRSGLPRIKNQRYAPSCLRKRASASHGSPVHPKNLREANFRSAVQRVGPRALRQKVSLNQASRPPEDADAFAGDDPAELSSFHLVVV